MPRRTSRVNYRYCSKCKGSGDAMITPCSCSQPNTYIHQRCLIEHMYESQEINCGKCGSEFKGVSYTYTPKNLSDYLVEVKKAQQKLWSVGGLILSTIISIISLSKLWQCDWEDFTADISNLKSIHSLPNIKHNCHIVMMIHEQIFLPFLAIFYTFLNAKEFYADFLEYQKRCYNINFLTQPSQPPPAKSRKSRSSRLQ